MVGGDGRNGSKTYEKMFSLISNVENADSNHNEIAFHTHHQIGRLLQSWMAASGALGAPRYGGKGCWCWKGQGTGCLPIREARS